MRGVINKVMRRLRVLFIGKNTRFTFDPLFAVSKFHDIVGLVESDHSRHYDKEQKQSLKNDFTIYLRRVFRKPSLKSISVAWKIPIFFLSKESETDLLHFVKQVNPDIICVASMSRLLKREIFSFPKYGAVNLHPSLLPKYRGPMPYFWVLFNDEKVTGVTAHYINEDEDTGDIIAQSEFSIQFGETYKSVEQKIIDSMKTLITKVLNDISEENIFRSPQPAASPTMRARKLKKGEQILEWQKWPIERAWHFLQGIYFLSDIIPLPSKYTPKYGPLDGWQITVFEKSTSDISKILDKDRKGWFLCHPEGRIYLRYEINLLNILKHLIKQLFKAKSRITLGIAMIQTLLVEDLHFYFGL